jgi:hypothetical protein
MNFTGGFGIDGLISEEERWNTIGNEISRLILPWPYYGSADHEREGGYKIKLYDPSCIHFADVLVSDDVRNADNFDEIEKWLSRIAEKMKKKDWRIRCGCIFVSVGNRPPVIYYCNGEAESEPCVWRKIKNVNGEILA